MSEGNGNTHERNGTPKVDWENDVATFEAPDVATYTVLVVAVNRLLLPGRPLYSYRIGSYKVTDGKFSQRIPVKIERRPVAPVVSVVGINAALFVDLFRQADAWVLTDCMAHMRPDDLLTLAEKREREREQAAVQPLLRKAAR